jgi:hypothetical protein
MHPLATNRQPPLLQPDTIQTTLIDTPIERDDLVAALHARGVCYLAPTPLGDERVLSDGELLIGLAQSKDARLRFAVAGLLLVHPELASTVIDLIEPVDTFIQPQLSTLTRRELQKQYLAALYLQRMWRTRLRLALGDTPLIPEHFTQADGHSPWPAADAMHGKQGLHQLTESSPFNEWSSYEQVVELICHQPCAASDLISMQSNSL